MNTARRIKYLFSVLLMGLTLAGTGHATPLLEKLEYLPIPPFPQADETTPPWFSGDRQARLAEYRRERPPRVEGIEQSSDPLRAWSDYLALTAEAARESGDLETYRKLSEEWLFLLNEMPFDEMARIEPEYASALEVFNRQLMPEPWGINLTHHIGRLNFDDARKHYADQRDAALKIAAMMPRTHLRSQEFALYERARTGAERGSKAPFSAGIDFPLVLSEVVRLHANLVAQGKLDRAGQFGRIADALFENALMKPFNFRAGYRNGFAESGEWRSAAGNAIIAAKVAEAYFPEESPRIIETMLFAASDSSAAGLTERVSEQVESAKRICGQQSECTSLASLALSLELSRFLDDERLSAASELFASSIGLGEPEGQDRPNRLDELPALLANRLRCESQLNTENGLLTKSGRLGLSQCSYDLGRAAIEIYEEAGYSFEASGEVRLQYYETGLAAVEVGDHQLGARLLEKANEGFIRENNVSGASIVAAKAALANARIGNVTKAQRLIDEGWAFARDEYTGGLLRRDFYADYVRDFEEAQIAVHLADPNASQAAFDWAVRRAERDRKRRLSIATTVKGEEDFKKALSLDENFLVLLAAAWKAREVSPHESLSQAFLAAQDILLDSTSIDLSFSIAGSEQFATTDEIAQLVTRRRELVEELGQFSSNDYLAFSEFGAGAAGQIRQRQFFEQRSDLSAELTDTNTQLENLAPNYFAMIRPKGLGETKAREILRADEAAIMVVPADDGTHVFYTDNAQVRWARSKLKSAEISRLVRRLRWFLDYSLEATANEEAEWTANVDGAGYGFDRDTAHFLYRELIEPFAEQLAGKSHLFLATHGPLSSLPFSVLVTETPEGRDDDAQSLRETAWFGDQIALVQIPSLQALGFLRLNPNHSEDGDSIDFLGFGDPILEGVAVSRGGTSRGTKNVPRLRSVYSASGQGVRSSNKVVDVNAIRKLNRLPGTAKELTAMANAFASDPDVLRLGDQATESSLKAADLSQAEVIAFATHGLVAGELQPGMEPGLVFTPPPEATSLDDGLLTASEIAALDLSAQWVILSACNTASSDGAEGAAAFSGLVRAFFYAGTERLLASHWPVDDEVAATITVRAIELANSNPGLSRAEAFRLAMIEIRNDESHNDWAHPIAWAPFVIVGDR